MSCNLHPFRYTAYRALYTFRLRYIDLKEFDLPPLLCLTVLQLLYKLLSSCTVQIQDCDRATQLVEVSNTGLAQAGTAARNDKGAAADAHIWIGNFVMSCSGSDSYL